MKTYIHYLHDISDDDWYSFYSLVGRKKRTVEQYRTKFRDLNELQKVIRDETNSEEYNFISGHLDLEKYYKNIVFSTQSKSYVENVDFNDVRAIINFKLINNIKQINKHFHSVNTLLPDGGIYIGRIETYWGRKIRFQRMFGYKLGSFLWLVDFVINRIIPKVRPIEKIYNYVTQKKIHVISRAEILGRLVYSGFEIIEYSEIENILYFAVIKTKEPHTDSSPSYHPIIKLTRIGKNGKHINIYKFRTMHPYSEYLQDFIIRLNGYNIVGKPANDFRLARWGKWMRKLWLDELPQIINVLKGDMKIVGVRPLSDVRYNEFPEDLKKERIKYKPGCIPPYVALNMPDDKGNIEAERIYFNDMKKNPYLTDIRYIIKAIFNIVTNKIRSS